MERRDPGRDRSRVPGTGRAAATAGGMRPARARLTVSRGAPVALRARLGHPCRAGFVGAAAVAWLAGCAPTPGPPAIALGTECVTCGMEVRDLRFACERADGRDWRVYDAIECLLADPGPRGVETYLADYDQQALHRADSMWVVKGEFASPMGGGLVAFLDLAAADSIAAATRGRVDRLAAFDEAAARGAR